MPVREIIFPDGVKRSVMVDDGATEDQIRESAMQWYAENREEIPSFDEFGDEVNWRNAREEADANKPGFFDRAAGVVDALATTGLNVATGAPASVLQQTQAVANIVTGGKLGDRTAIMEEKVKADERASRLAVQPFTPEGAGYVEAMTPFLNTLEALGPVGAAGGLKTYLGRSALGPTPTAGDSLRLTRDNVLDQVARIKPSRQEGNNAGAMQTTQEAMDLAAAQERMERMRQLGIEGESGPTAGQLTRNPELQGREGVLRTLGGGEELQRRFDEQNSQLKSVVDRGVYATGSGPDGDYRPMTDLDVGGNVKTTLREGEARSAEAVNRAYEIARNSPESDIVVSPSNLSNLINGEDFGRLSIAAQTKDAVAGLKTYLNKSGLGSFDDDGKVTLRPASIRELEDLRSQVGDFFDPSNPQQRRAGDMFRKAIDEQLDEVEGGDLFKAARAERRRHAEEFEEHDFVSRALDNKGKTSADKIPDEQVAAGVEKLSNAELGRLKAQLLALGESGAASWRQLSAQILSNIKERSLRPATRGIDNEPRIDTETLATSLERLDSAGKLDMLFGKETAAQLRTLIQVARDLNQPIRGTQNPSGTNNAQKITEGMILRALDTKTGGLARPLVGWLRGGKVSREAAELLDGEGMLKSMGGGK